MSALIEQQIRALRENMANREMVEVTEACVSWCKRVLKDIEIIRRGVFRQNWCSEVLWFVPIWASLVFEASTGGNHISAATQSLLRRDPQFTNKLLSVYRLSGTRAAREFFNAAMEKCRRA